MMQHVQSGLQHEPPTKRYRNAIKSNQTQHVKLGLEYELLPKANVLFSVGCILRSAHLLCPLPLPEAAPALLRVFDNCNDPVQLQGRGTEVLLASVCVDTCTLTCAFLHAVRCA